MAGPYGRISKGSDTPATAGYTDAQVRDMLDNSFMPVPVKYTIDAVSPVWLRTETDHPCLLQFIPAPAEPMAGEYIEAPTSSQAGFEDNDDIDVPDSRGDRTYPALTRAELEAVRPDLVDILEVDPDLEEQFLQDTSETTDRIREFLFKQIAPMAVGSSIAFDEFNQELTTILGENVASNFSAVKHMLEDAMTLKTFEFLSGTLGLSAENVRDVLSVYLAKRIGPTTRPSATGKMLKDLINATKDA